MVNAGQFRADLYYRLNVIALTLPPLRERGGDVRGIGSYFCSLRAGVSRVASEANFLARLDAHTWPGNVRELANCMRRVTAGVGPGDQRVFARGL